MWHYQRWTSMLLLCGCMTVVASRLRSQVPAPPSRADSTHLAATIQMLEAMGVGKSLEESIAEAVADSSEDNPIPASMRAAFMEKVRASLPAFRGSIAPLYADRLTSAEVQQATEYFRSPIALRIEAVTRETSDSLSILSERWMLKIFGELMVEMGDGALPMPEED